MILCIVFISFFSTIYLLQRVLSFLKINNNIITNYNNIKVYNSSGIFIILNILLFCTFILLNECYIDNQINISGVVSVVVGVLSTAFTGYMDDTANDIPKGLKGHFRSLLSGEFTSGVFKAIVGFFSSLIICIAVGYKNTDLFLNSAIILLSQNFFNLMDLRPGRAIKAYLAFSILVFTFTKVFFLYYVINAGIIISLLIYLPYEMKEICMLGDTGSNTLGIVMGIFMSSIVNLKLRLLILSFLVFCHLYAEKKSISSFILNNKALRYIDLMGRKNKYDKD